MSRTPSANTSTVILRSADQRFHSQLDWLDSWHSFSFGSHQDPNWMGFGPLRVINDDTIAAGQGFGMHPHRDMEIITVMVEGALTHADSMGNSAVLRAGEVQRMSAGRGIVHSEINQTGAPCRLLQIWIEPAQLGLWRAQPLCQQQLPLPDAKERWLWLQVIDGELTLNREGSPTQALRRGDGLGLIQDGSTQGELVGLNGGADVLLFALE